MPSNIEIKARVTDPSAIRVRVESLCGSAAEILEQEDFFFAAPAARLKLRVFAADRGELILYQRPNAAGPKLSEYQLAQTSSPGELKKIMSAVLPSVGTVRKRRRVYHWGNTRLHLDEVERLGNFIELEVVLGEGQPVSEGVLICEELMARLGISPDQMVRQAYVDLLAEGGNID